MAIATCLLALLSDPSCIGSSSSSPLAVVEAFSTSAKSPKKPLSVRPPPHRSVDEQQRPASGRLELNMAFRNYRSDENPGTMGGGAGRSDRDRREEQRRTYERHQERRRQYEQRQYEQKMQQEEEQALEYERQQEQEQQERNSRSVSFIALLEHEGEVMKLQEKFEAKKNDLQRLIGEQRRQLDAIRESETKLRCKQQMHLQHYTQYNNNNNNHHDGGSNAYSISGNGIEANGGVEGHDSQNYVQRNGHDPHETIKQRIARSSRRGVSAQYHPSSLSSPPSSADSSTSLPVSNPASTSSDVNLSMLWNENQNDKMKRMANSLVLLKEENERLSEQLEIEKTRFAVEKVFMEQKLIEKDTELQRVKDELRIDREMYETTISLLELNLQREQKKVQGLEATVEQRNSNTAAPAADPTSQAPSQDQQRNGKNVSADPAATAQNQQQQRHHQPSGAEYFQQHHNQYYQQQQQQEQQEQQVQQEPQQPTQAVGKGKVPGSAAAYHQQNQQSSSQPMPSEQNPPQPEVQNKQRQPFRQEQELGQKPQQDLETQTQSQPESNLGSDPKPETEQQVQPRVQQQAESAPEPESELESEPETEEQLQPHAQEEVVSESDEWEDIAIIDPEPYVAPTTRRRQAYEARKRANFKYYQPPDQEQYHQQPEPNQSDYYRNFQQRRAAETNQRQYQQQQQQQYQHHQKQQRHQYAYHDSGRNYHGYSTVNGATVASPSTAHATSTATGAPPEDEDYHYYRSYRATPSQRRRSNSAMPHSMRADQPHPNSNGGGGYNNHNGRRDTRFYRNFGSSSSSSSTNGSGFRAMGDFGNRNP
eukprot:CAMPEP_0113484160 /NCGR_PEP_ID=MMETSP0014_2-20120614/23817_1 /TAXON_ID=2857 /ORGANISM="Nitzschia sp." /LENGTH=819 /DNA_ID=CAMNT_0000377751 /DNA_START=203 /DNA_END=2662 /DNA_ORIENTATION=+ /assembly_acc=CAM_ASM_000159